MKEKNTADNKFKFEVSFSLKTLKGEKLDLDSIKEFQKCLEAYVEDYNGYHGSFYAYNDGNNVGYDTDIDPTNIRVKRIK
jgi:hypothetical protein